VPQGVRWENPKMNAHGPPSAGARAALATYPCEPANDESLEIGQPFASRLQAAKSGDTGAQLWVRWPTYTSVGA